MTLGDNRCKSLTFHGLAANQLSYPILSSHEVMR